jgi:hypothetical protein
MCTLSVFLNVPGGGVAQGEVMRKVEFWYRPTDNTTGDASLSVISSTAKGSTQYITGLWFCTGQAANKSFSIVLVGGNYGAYACTHINVHLDIKVMTHDTNVVALADYADITFVTAATDADDETDSIDLLTVADTAITAP